MSAAYDAYLMNRKNGVKQAYQWIKNHLPWLLDAADGDELDRNIENHDASKYSKEEYKAYDDYFYKKYEEGDGEGPRHTPEEVGEAFDEAWLHHIDVNPHHWRHWVVVNVDEPDPEKWFVPLEMDFIYVIEMICDWWGFSFEKGDLYEIFDWYKTNSRHIKLHDKTRQLVDYILALIKGELDREKEGGKIDA